MASLDATSTSQTIGGRPRTGRAAGPGAVAGGQGASANGAGGGGDAFSKMGAWDNALAEGMMSIPHELEAFGERMPPRRSDAQLQHDRQEDSISEDEQEESDAEDRDREREQLLSLVRDSAQRE